MEVSNTSISVNWNHTSSKSKSEKKKNLREKDYGKKGYLLIKRNDGDEWPYGVCPINAAPGFPIKEVASSLAL